ncbi:50S ribosomal protein L4 [Clostridioides difficile]|uniref:Large ribosomal subunit protein uL4 n=3 Tax=Clostridioides difficile TaxID=1496 RepID=A0AAX3H6U4_CLODI|nr:50S ribosomal protein L4 [Clostridioides difficile]EFH08222.1 50S ribosomal protein L4 [Clostridioides difficile NAP08]EFH16987.1 50S ribosomal protein L4 [Clostridioides difficile NAP07]CCK89722.1 50S ribosomal protein L4 [Clostridioides difficile T5]CCK93569.1 50S ribosomal protein L4 [Clostridioides difficile T20]CCK97234.1 50S ribosomal protein L4 [Clostridioides difficile E1]CCL01219.1 50S ribosomal protein L4 [Clostridioides difficile E10]SHO33798.1 50S ribosomal protein L4 112233:1
MTNLEKGGITMPKLNVLNVSGQNVGEIELSDSIFGVEVNGHVLYEVVKNQLANKRQGTQSAKTRAEVRGGGRKPWKQKGTGRARQGSTRSVQWVGGGVAFAPKPRSYKYTLPKKVRRLAMKSALSSKVQNSEVIVLDALNMDAPKTKEFAQILNNINAAKKALVVIADKNDNIIKSARNIEGVQTALVNTMNVYDILKYDSFIITTDAVKKVEEVYA